MVVGIKVVVEVVSVDVDVGICWVVEVTPEDDVKIAVVIVEETPNVVEEDA